MSTNTPNLNLKKINTATDGSNTFNIDTDLNDNWDKIDTKVKELEDGIGDITVPVTKVNGKTGEVTLSAGDIKAADNKTIEQKFTDVASDLADMATQVATKAVNVDNTRNTTAKDVTGAINELFTNANNGKQNWVDVVGSPLVNTDAFATLKSKTQTLKNTMATNLTAKGQSSAGTESLNSLVNKIPSISTGKKWASGTVTSSGSQETYKMPSGDVYSYSIVVTGLTFTPSVIVCTDVTYGMTLTAVDVGATKNSGYTIIDRMGIQIRLTTPAYISTNSFKLPVVEQNTGYRWIAFE